MVQMVIMSEVQRRCQDLSERVESSFLSMLSLETFGWWIFLQGKSSNCHSRLSESHLPLLARNAPVLIRIGLMCILHGQPAIKHADGRVTLSQSHFAADVIVSKNKCDPDVKMSGDRDAMSEFRSAIGSLQWLAGTTRADLAADTSLIQKAHGDLTRGDLQEATAMLLQSYSRHLRDHTTH